MEFSPCKPIKGNLLFDVDSPKKNSRKKKFTYEYPFNLDFNIKKELDKDIYKGPAIYVIEFESEVIYIGKYRPEDKNLISTRWVKHIMTFTNRGYRVGGSALSKLVEGEFSPHTFHTKFEENIKNYFLEINTNNAVNIERFNDTGTVTSFNRLKFADSIVANGKWVDQTNIDISNFTFNCFTLSGNEDDILKRKELVSIIEQILICKHKPRCNKECNHESSKIKLTDVENDLRKSLNDLLSILKK
jgi:hypothetical protein